MSSFDAENMPRKVKAKGFILWPPKLINSNNGRGPGKTYVYSMSNYKLEGSEEAKSLCIAPMMNGMKNEGLEIRQELTQDRYPEGPNCGEQILRPQHVYKVIGECIEGKFYQDPCSLYYEYKANDDTDQIWHGI